MKKLFVFILTAAMLLSSCTNTPLEQNDPEDTSSNGGGSVTSYSVDPDNLNYKPKGGVVDSTLRHAADITSYKTREQVEDFLTAPYSQICGEYTYIMRIFPEDLSSGEEYYAYLDGEKTNFGIEIYKNTDFAEPVETVYLESFEGKNYSPRALSYDPGSEQFWLLINEYIDGDYDYKLYHFDRNGALIKSAHAERSGYEKYIIFGGKLYSVRNNGNSHTFGKLVCSDPFSESEEIIHEDALCVFVSDDRLYFIAREITADYTTVLKLCEYDPESHGITEILNLGDEKSIASASYDAENGILYYSDLTYIYAVKDDEQIPVISTYEANPDVLYVQDGYLVTRIGYNQLALYMTESAPESLDIQKVVLNICWLGSDDSDSLFRDTVTIMNATGLSVTLNITYSSFSTDEYVSTMAKKLLAGDSDFDLFVVSSDMSELMVSEYFADLDEFDVLRDRFVHMIPGLKELSTVEGKAALMPIGDLRLEGVFYADPSYKEQYGMPGSYSELFKAPDSLPDDVYLWSVPEIFGLSEIRFNTLAANFMAKTVSDEQAENDMLRLFEEAAAAKNNPDIRLGINSRDHKALYRTKNFFGTNCTDMIPVQIVGDGYKNSVSGEFFAMNPNSPSKTLAAAFLAYYVHSTDEWVTRNLYFTDTAERALSYSENRTSSGKDARTNYELFCSQIANSVLASQIDGFRDKIFDLCCEVEKGTIIPAEAAREAYRFMKMARDE